MVKRAPFPPIQGSGRMHANNGVSRRNIPFDASSFYRSASFFLWECFLNNFFIWSLAGGPSIHGETQRIETQLEVRELLAHRAFAPSCPTAMSFLALARRGRTCRVATICRPERTLEEESVSWEWREYEYDFIQTSLHHGVSSPRPCLVLKFFQHFLSHQIFIHMHVALNAVEKITNYTVQLKITRFKSN